MQFLGYPRIRLTLVLCGLWLLAAGAQAAELPDFSKLAEQKSPAVVKITTRGVSQAQAQLPPDHGQLPELFQEFFERRQQPEREQRSMGSGFVISADGYVLTNNHVVEDADTIQVRLIDRREYEAEVVGTDPRSDLALLKIDAEDLPHLEFAKADSVKVGEWVLAIGSPFGLDYSVSAGIVSAVGRSIPGPRESNYVPFIQTDVAINPGNSGGPLFNLKGEVVGINSQIYTRSGGSIGLSFAIPAGLAQDVVAQLRENGQVERGWLGVVIQGVNRDLAQSFGLDKPIGALISQLDPEGPAAASGLKVGDIILKFNGREVEESGDLPPMVGRLAPGTKVPVEIMRKGKQRDLKVEIGRLDDQGGVESGAPGSRGGQSGDPLGLTIGPNDEAGGEPGVLVREVAPGSAAAKAGLRPGDVITQLGYEPVTSVPEYRQRIKDLPEGEPIAVRFLRDGQPAFTSLRLE